MHTYYLQFFERPKDLNRPDLPGLIWLKFSSHLSCHTSFWSSFSQQHLSHSGLIYCMLTVPNYFYLCLRFASRNFQSLYSLLILRIQSNSWNRNLLTCSLFINECNNSKIAVLFGEERQRGISRFHDYMYQSHFHISTDFIFFY